MALAMLAVGACYPNPDALRVDRSGAGSGGATGFAGMTGAAGHDGVGGALGTAGSGGGNNQCGAPACGGNLLGTWTFTTSCMGVLPVDTCAGEMIDASGIHRAGTLTFNGNGTYSTTETDTGTFVFDFPTTCLSGVTCAALQTTYQGAGYVGQPNPTFSSATCFTTATGCRCLFGALGMPATDTGTYVVNGTSVTATSVMGGVAADAFCVSGSTLHMIYADSTPSSPDELFLMKQ